MRVNWKRVKESYFPSSKSRREDPDQPFEFILEKKDTQTQLEHWADLLRSAQRGNKEDYRQFLSELNLVLRNHVQEDYPHIQDVSEFVKEVLLKIHKKRHTFTIDSSFLFWVYGIVRRVHESRSPKEHKKARHYDSQVLHQLNIQLIKKG